MKFFIISFAVIVICTQIIGTCASNIKSVTNTNADKDTGETFNAIILKRIDTRIFSEVTKPFESCIWAYNVVFKTVWELLKNKKNLEKGKLPKIDEKHQKILGKILEKLQETRVSSSELGKYIGEVIKVTNNDISVAKKQIDQLKKSLKFKQSELVKLDDNLKKLNNDIKTEEDSLKKEQSNLKEVMVKTVKPSWWCILAGPFAPACLVFESQKKVNDIKDKITKLEGSISGKRNRISHSEYQRYGVVSQIQDFETEIKKLSESLSSLQKLAKALTTRLEVCNIVANKISTVVKDSDSLEGPSQNVPKSQKKHGGFSLASEEFLQLMHELGAYLKKIEGGRKTKLEPTITEEQILKILEVFRKMPKPDLVATSK